MTIQDLGSIGKLIAAIATIATLAYLAVQMRQNTSALRSSTFQAITADMARSSEAIATNADLAEIMFKSVADSAGLSPVERTRYGLTMLMIFRRFEAVYIQGLLGSIDMEMTEPFERSALQGIATGSGAQWWAATKYSFSSQFVAHVDRQLAAGVGRPQSTFVPPNPRPQPGPQ